MSSTATLASELVLWTDNSGYPTAQDEFNYPVYFLWYFTFKAI